MPLPTVLQHDDPACQEVVRLFGDLEECLKAMTPGWRQRKLGMDRILARNRKRFSMFAEVDGSRKLRNRIHHRESPLPNDADVRTAEASLRLALGEILAAPDPKKIKVAIYQTKFWPEYRRDKVYSKSSAHASATSSTDSTAAGSFSGLSSGTAFFQPDQWFPQGQGMTVSDSSSSGSSSMSGSSSSSSESWGDSEGEADIPIFFPVPFEELSSVQYYSLEEQLTEATVALKQQFPRHCFIKLPDQETQPLLVPFVKPF